MLYRTYSLDNPLNLNLSDLYQATRTCQPSARIDFRQVLVLPYLHGLHEPKFC